MNAPPSITMPAEAKNGPTADRLRADANIQPGAKTPLAFNLSKSVFFDPATANRIA